MGFVLPYLAFCIGIGVGVEHVFVGLGWVGSDWSGCVALRCVRGPVVPGRVSKRPRVDYLQRVSMLVTLVRCFDSSHTMPPHISARAISFPVLLCVIDFEYQVFPYVYRSNGDRQSFARDHRVLVRRV